MVFDPAKFAQGNVVRVADATFLGEFLETWKYHHPLAPEQLAFAGRTAKVKSSGMYHGGDVLYVLEDVPGIWHEICLREPET